MLLATAATTDMLVSYALYAVSMQTNEKSSTNYALRRWTVALRGKGRD